MTDQRAHGKPKVIPPMLNRVVRASGAVAVAIVLVSPASLCAQRPDDAAPLVIGDMYTIQSEALGEKRRINVYAPAEYAASADARLPVLYMPDGGLGEDFLHIAGLLQISALNGTMRPFLLVGIENTQRRRDLTGPTENAEDRAIASATGGSAAFRRFIRTELMPFIDARYRTSGEKAIVGESLAGIFVVETLLLEPDLFDTYIAFDPSLWWNNAKLLEVAATHDSNPSPAARTLYLASSGEPELARLATRLAGLLNEHGGSALTVHYAPMPDETHSSIYHPAALRAFREIFRPPED